MSYTTLLIAVTVSLAAIFALLDLYVVTREEAYLARRFGAEYAGYQSCTRRWV